MFTLATLALGYLVIDVVWWHNLDWRSRWVTAVSMVAVTAQTILVAFDRTVRVGRWTGRLFVSLSTASGSALGTVGGIFAGACFNFLVLYLVPGPTPLSEIVQYSFAILSIGALVLALAYFRVLGRLAFTLLRWHIRSRHDHVTADYAIATGPKGIGSFLSKPPYAAWDSKYMRQRLSATSYGALEP